MSCCDESTRFAFDSPHAAVDAVLDRLEPLGVERSDLSSSVGRVLAEPVRADRDSPPADVSAMDGYAVRLACLERLIQERLPVSATVIMGQPPPELAEGGVLRVATGACVPAQAEAVIPREWLDESADSITWADAFKPLRPGQNIRRRGENRKAGATVIEPGRLIDAGVAGALAGFGCVVPRVYRQVNVTVLTTGDEVLDADERPTDWQIRNSNGPAIKAFLLALPWVDRVTVRHVADSAQAVADAMRDAIDAGDALITAGGVSMGDRDYIPQTIRSLGGTLVYHKLPMRPGKPNLGALSACGKPILALPGNPVAVLVALRLIVEPVLRRLAGFARRRQPRALLRLNDSGNKVLPLWWYRPVELIADGQARLVPSLGSGDFASAADAAGFIETPPNRDGVGPWPFYDA